MIKIVSSGFRIPNIYSFEVCTDDMCHDGKFIRHIAYSKGCSKLRCGIKYRKKMYYIIEFNNNSESEKCKAFIRKCHLYDKSM